MMHRKILNLKRKIRRNKKKISAATFVIFCCIVIAGIGLSFYLTQGNFAGSSSVEIPGFAPKVNGSDDMSQEITLTDTITNGKRLAPGAIGKFKIDIDFSNVGYDSNYNITFDRTNIPNNIHFYVDKELTKEITNIEGIQLKDYDNKEAEHYIYWKWIYNNTPESNENDSQYMNQEITLPFTVQIIQRIERNTLIVNEYERPTGRIYLSGTSGSFDIDVDFKNISTQTNYKLYFTKDNSNLHLYSDSEYQNEITSIDSSYDEINREITKTIYWRLDTDPTDNLSVYYIIY